MHDTHPMLIAMGEAMRRDYAAHPEHCWAERARAALTALLEVTPDVVAVGEREMLSWPPEYWGRAKMAHHAMINHILKGGE